MTRRGGVATGPTPVHPLDSGAAGADAPQTSWTVDDEYLTLAQLADYAKISARQLRKYLALPPAEALPCYRPGRKVVVRRREFDVWFGQFRRRGKPVLVQVLRELGLDPERVPDVRPPRSASNTPARAPRR